MIQLYQIVLKRQHRRWTERKKEKKEKQQRSGQTLTQVDLFNVRLSPERHWQGPRSQQVGGLYLTLCFVRQSEI